MSAEVATVAVAEGAAVAGGAACPVVTGIIAIAVVLGIIVFVVGVYYISRDKKIDVGFSGLTIGDNFKLAGFHVKIN